MLSSDQALQLIRSGTIKITPLSLGNFSNGSFKLTLDKKGNFISPPTADDYQHDPREVVINVFQEDFPFSETDVDTFALYPFRNIVVNSVERIKLPSTIFGVVYPTYKSSVPLEISVTSILLPSQDNVVTFKIKNPWQYPVYLKAGEVIAEVVFYSTEHKYHTGLDSLDHPASAIIFNPYKDITVGNVQEAVQKLADEGFDLQSQVEGLQNQLVGLVGVVDHLSEVSGSSPKLMYVSKTEAYTLTSEDDMITCSGTFAVTLPTITGITGKVFYIKNIGTGIITVGANNTETIDGEATQSIDIQYDSITVVAGSSEWHVI